MNCQSTRDNKVYYYKRRGALSNLSHIPYIVNSRKSSELLKNLLANDLPIIMEGMHSTFLIGNKFLEERCIIYRESNEEFFALLCKNQTCSEKLKDLNQINNYIKNNL